MKQPPDILTSVTFWAAVGTLLSAAGAWFAYAGTVWASRKQNHDALTNLIAGVEAELELVSELAHGGKGDQGFLLSKNKVQLVKEHPDWFNPSRMISKVEAPTLSSLTSSPFAKSVGKRLPTFVLLNHAIRLLMEQVDRLNNFALGDLALYQSVMVKYGAKGDPADIAFSPVPAEVVVPLPHTIQWTDLERTYINLIFVMNAGIHQHVIGGAEGPSIGLYQEFRSAKRELEEFELAHLKPESQPWWHCILHVLAAIFLLNALWQVLRWYEVWPSTWR
jgi:hypothetical protein